jgi:ABC-type sugar transport system ATPase subunit
VVQQLEQNMRRLRQWLAHIEHELSAPIIYTDHDFNEIQNKLQEQQVNGITI